MGQGWWGNIMSGASTVPGIGSGVNLVRGITQAAEGKNPSASFLGLLPGVQDYIGIEQIASGGKSPITGGGGKGGDPAGATEQFLQGRIPGMSYEQVYGSDPHGASATANAIIKELQGMPATDAQKFLAALSKQYPGSPLLSDISNVQSGTATATAPTNPYDTIGKILQSFSGQALPWLSQQMQASDKGSANLASQMQAALSKASPAMQQAYSVGIPELQAANLSMDKAAASSLATQPQWDALISGLTDAASAYKAATAAAQSEPYWAATTSGTTPSGSPGQTTLDSLQKQILGAQAASH